MFLNLIVLPGSLSKKYLSRPLEIRQWDRSGQKLLVGSYELKVGAVSRYSLETGFLRRCFVTRVNIFVETGFLSNSPTVQNRLSFTNLY